MYLVFRFEQVDVYENEIEQTGDINSVVVYQELVAEFKCFNEVEKYAKGRQDLSVFDCSKKEFVDSGSIEVKHWEK